MHLSSHTPHARSLGLAGATNFRDLGGYPGSQGRPVRWRRLFRSNHLGHLTAEDHTTLGALGLRHVVDFRSPAEVAQAAPGLVPGATLHALPIEPAIGAQLRARLDDPSGPTASETAALMRALYGDFVRAHADRFRSLFQHLLEADAPLVFHCSAGKDRTGLAAALVLSALGVPRTVVEADYLLTNRLWRLERAGQPFPEPVVAVLESADLAFLDAAFDTISTEFGGMDAFLQQRMGLDATRRAALEARYLED